MKNIKSSKVHMRCKVAFVEFVQEPAIFIHKSRFRPRSADAWSPA